MKPSATPLDDDDAMARVRAFFGAVDGRDRAALMTLVSDDFFLFEEGYLMGAKALSKRWAEPLPKSLRRHRVCKQEQLRRSADTIIYLGNCSERQPPKGDQPARHWQGWSTVMLSRERDAWRVGFWQWQQGGIETTRNSYNEVYRKGEAYSEQPNALLSTAVSNEKPGKALVLAMGQGRNALYLASQGWEVTGVDISDEGLRVARRNAEQRGLKLNAIQTNIDAFDFGEGRWDLVTMIYAGSDKAWIEQSKKSLKPGGLFIFEFRLRKPGNESTDPFAGIVPGALAKQFKGWEVIKNNELEAVADWGMTKAPLARFIARKPNNR